MTIFCFKLTGTTDKMFMTMNSVDNKNVIITDKLEPEDFLTTVKCSILTTISRHGQINKK
jgi:hypothetical protein